MRRGRRSEKGRKEWGKRREGRGKGREGGVRGGRGGGVKGGEGRRSEQRGGEGRRSEVRGEWYKKGMVEIQDVTGQASDLYRAAVSSLLALLIRREYAPLVQYHCKYSSCSRESMKHGRPPLGLASTCTR